MTSITDLYKRFIQHPLISTDSRTIPAGCIFFALKGEHFNGNAFAKNALEKGAAYAVIDEAEFKINDRCLLSEDVLTTLQQLARHHRQQLQIPVIGITGSNGKTTTKELLNAVLSEKYKTFATKGNLNNHIGVPLSILSVTSGHEVAVIEMGANHQKEIEKLCEIALPSYGLITNVGKAHLEGFGGFEGVKKGKGELYEFISRNQGKIFLNSDNPHLLKMAAKAGVTDIIHYGTSEDVACKGELVATHPFLKIRWSFGNIQGVIHSQLIGEYNFENILAAVSVGNYFEVEAQKVNHAIESYTPDNSRSQVVLKGSNKIILDAYNANPTSMAAALKNFSALEDAHKIIFLGEMSELGEESEREHQAIADLLNAMQMDELVLVGKKFIGTRLSKNCLRFTNSEEAASYAKEKKYSRTAILIKGSRSTKMEKVFEAL